MRSIGRMAAGLMLLLAHVPALAQGIAIDSAVYRERGASGAVAIEPAQRLLRGDRVITIVRWEAPPNGRYTATSAVPSGLVLQSASYRGLEVSTDGGRSWHRPDGAAALPAGITHLRWPLQGDGRLSYRAVVR